MEIRGWRVKLRLSLVPFLLAALLSSAVLPVSAAPAPGSLYGWGANWYGQLGDGAWDSRSTEVQVTSTEDVVAVAAAAYHTLVLRSDGVVWASGSNSNGQRGDSARAERNTLAPVGGLSNASSIAAGLYHSLAVKSDGTVWAWGANSYGQLGDGNGYDRSSPVQAAGLTDVVAVAGAGYHSLALKSDGSVWAWGANWYGQLGDGTLNNRRTPVQVSLLTDIVAISAGAYHSLALKSDGTVWAWGANWYGQLGDGTGYDRSAPVRVLGLTAVTAVSAGPYHGLALRSDGTVRAWGTNGNGQLGDGTTSERRTPVRVNGLANVSAIAAGAYHGLALKSDATTWAWGANWWGQLGDGTFSDHFSPARASMPRAMAIAAGWYSSFAIKAPLPIISVDAGPDAAAGEGEAFSQAGSFTDTGGSTWAAVVDYGDGSGPQPLPLTGQAFRLDHVYADDGTFSVTVTVWDELDVAGSDSLLVKVNNADPAVVAGPSAAMDEGDVFARSGWFSDPGADAWTATVDYGDGSAPQPLALNGTGFSLSHAYDDNGVYTVTVTVADDDGGLGAATVLVDVGNVAPAVTAGAAPGIQYWGLPIEFTGTVVDPSNADTTSGFSLQWAFGDAGSAVGLNAGHVYATPGEYAATLRATDKDGGQGSAVAPVTVNRRSAELTYTGDSTVLFGSSATLSATLGDNVVPGASLAGRAITFTVDGIDYTVITDTAGRTGPIGLSPLPPLPPGNYVIWIRFAGDDLYLPAAASATLTVVSSASGKITGNGLRFGDGWLGGLTAETDRRGELRGQLRYQNGAFRLFARTITGLSLDGTTGWVAGILEDGRQFVAYVEDNGPGAGDIFRLWVDGVLYNPGGALAGGNIQVF